MLASLVALVLAQASLTSKPSGPPPIRLEVLRATSGAGVERLLDGSAATGWRPDGDPRDEGVLFRFEEPTPLQAIRVQGCGGDGALVLFVNGAEGGALGYGSNAPSEGRLGPGEVRVRTLFLAFTWPKAGACLGEVTFLRAGQPVAVLPPRQVAGRVAASSTLSPAAAYHPSYLFDGRPDFGWVEGAKGAGEGEEVTIDLERPVDLQALELWNGYQRSPVHFQANARARTLEVSRDGAAPVAVQVKDRMGSQKLTLPPGPPVSRLRLRIAAVFPGSKYQDLVLSELRLWDTEGPLAVRTADGGVLEAALREAVKGGALGAVLDRELTFGCDQVDLSRRLKLRRDHTFVAYELNCPPLDWVACTTVVLDGTWVPRPSGGGWAEVEIFARRHRVESAAGSPYAEQAPQVTTSDEIAGGRLRIALARDLDAASLRADAGGHPALQSYCLPPAESRVLVRGPALSADFALDVR